MFQLEAIKSSQLGLVF